MPSGKSDKYDILASVIDAIYDENNKVIIETTDLDALKAKKRSWVAADDNKPQIPTIQGEGIIGAWSKNHEHAQSVKIGKISMRHMPGKYIVRTPDGEAEFSSRDNDFKLVWFAAINTYDLQHGYKHEPGTLQKRIKDALWRNVKNPKLKEAAGKDIIKSDKKTKFQKAQEELNSLGVPVERMKKLMEIKGMGLGD